MAEDNQETKHCMNCKRDINVANFVMHEVHCRRHIALCEHCQEPVPKSELEQHFEENHAKIACGKCGIHVAKNVLEKHEEESCPKRQMKCHYCEMDVPQSDFESHSDYCGTRTEPCVKCGQFIMIKDQIKHEDSNCTYPTPKPTNGNGSNRNVTNGNAININTGASSVLDDDDLLFGTGETRMDPFMFDEIKRMFDSPNMGGASGISNSTRSREPRNVSQRVQNKNLPTGISVSKKEKNQAVKNKPNKKSDLNRQRELSVPHGDSPSNEEHDRLLAMHLAQDLNQDMDGDIDVDNLIQSFDKPLFPGYPARPIDNSAFTDLETDNSNLNNFDGMSLSMLPCEFCGEAMPSDLLVEHQSACSADPLSSLMPHNAASSQDGANNDIQQTDNRYSRIAQETRPYPPFIDNLGQGLDWTGTSHYDDTLSSEDFMLPCEFCDELFPMDMLVQHQAVCEANGTVTPRVTTPAPRKSVHRQEEPQSSSRSKKRQPEPDLSAILAKNSDRKHSTGASWSSHDVTPQQEIHSTMHKYGVAPGEPMISKSSRQAILEHLTRENEEKAKNTTRRTSHPTTTKRIDSAARTRNTLENLLHDNVPVPPSHDLHRHIGGASSTAKKYNKDNFNTKQKKTPINLSSSVTRTVPPGASGVTRSSRITTVNARDVHRELDQYDIQQSEVTVPRKTTKTTPSRSSRNSQSSTSDRPPVSSSTSNGAPRQRTRNNIFDNSSSRNTRPVRRGSDDNL